MIHAPTGVGVCWISQSFFERKRDDLLNVRAAHKVVIAADHVDSSVARVNRAGDMLSAGIERQATEAPIARTFNVRQPKRNPLATRNIYLTGWRWSNNP